MEKHSKKDLQKQLSQIKHKNHEQQESTTPVQQSLSSQNQETLDPFKQSFTAVQKFGATVANYGRRKRIIDRYQQPLYTPFYQIFIELAKKYDTT